MMLDIHPATCQKHNRVPDKDFEGRECYGDLWECERCKRTICAGFGAADSSPNVCDDCWCQLNPADSEPES